MANNYKISALIDCYGSLLGEKQKNIIELYYNEDLSLSEIAEIEGITRQGVSDFIKRGETSLLQFEENLKLYEKSENLKKIVNEAEVSKSSEKVNELFDYIKTTF